MRRDVWIFLAKIVLIIGWPSLVLLVTFFLPMMSEQRALQPWSCRMQVVQKGAKVYLLTPSMQPRTPAEAQAVNEALVVVLSTWSAQHPETEIAAVCPLHTSFEWVVGLAIVCR